MVEFVLWIAAEEGGDGDDAPAAETYRLPPGVVMVVMGDAGTFEGVEGRFW